MSSWTDAVPELAIAVSVAPCPSSVGDGVLCIEPSDEVPSNDLLGATWLAGEHMYGAHMTLYRTTIAKYGVPLAMVAEHELGHGMALVHSGPGNVMSPHAVDQAPEPTPDDVAQWRSLR